MRDGEKAVLRYLSAHEIWASAADIGRNISYDSGYVRTICKDFASRGFLEMDEQSGGPYYRMTDEGRKKLASELSGESEGGNDNDD